jgi:hypothetical protein
VIPLAWHEPLNVHVTAGSPREFEGILASSEVPVIPERTTLEPTDFLPGVCEPGVLEPAVPVRPLVGGGASMVPNTVGVEGRVREVLVVELEALAPDLLGE